MKRLEAILLKAFENRASDVHLSYRSPLFIRRFGSLIPLDVPEYSPADTEAIIADVLDEKQKTLLARKEDLDFSFEIPAKVRCRGNVFRQIRGGIDASFRLIPFSVPDRQDLGLPDVIDQFIDLSQGLVLVTGPAGSGKTTTLAVIVDAINKKHNRHIITIEDPVEYVFANNRSVINQREVGSSTLSFENALKAASREDPDIIVIGELRDMEAVSMALRCAETGYLVFGTLHTKDASGTINRVVDVFPPEEQPQIRAVLAENLRAILSQVLIPKPDGQGMALACEILLHTPALANLIREDKTFNIPSVIQTGKSAGMKSMKDSIEFLISGGALDESARRFIAESAG
jgi:twitching motility protein PilT